MDSVLSMNVKRILVVDDNPVILKTLEYKLRVNGFEVLTARDGGEAVSLVRRDRPDLVLLDIDFPPDVEHGGGVAWDGFLIMDWLRRMDEGKDVPVVMITGGEPAQYMDKALAAGVVCLLHKPIHTAELLEAVRHALGEGVSTQNQPV